MRDLNVHTAQKAEDHSDHAKQPSHSIAGLPTIAPNQKNGERADTPPDDTAREVERLRLSLKARRKDVSDLPDRRRCCRGGKYPKCHSYGHREREVVDSACEVGRSRPDETSKDQHPCTVQLVIARAKLMAPRLQ